MSCFVMNPESLSVIGNTLADCIYYAERGALGFHVPDSLSRVFNEYSTYVDAIWEKPYRCYDGEAIARKLAEINIAAFKECYDGRHMEDISEPYVLEGCTDRINLVTNPKRPGRACAYHYNFVKLLDCWLYQTCEGKIAYDETRLAIQDLRDAIYDFIVTSSPLYTGAPGWGKVH